MGNIGTVRHSGTASRFVVGLIAAFATASCSMILDVFPMTARLDPWAVLSLVSALLLGPAGLLGSTVVHFSVTAFGVHTPLWSLIHTGAYFLMGLVSFVFYRLIPNLDRGLSDMRAYLGFLAAGTLGSSVLAGIGSANLFPNTIGTATYWTAVLYWFSSAVTSLLIVAPCILVAAVWGFRPWLISLPGENSQTPEAGLFPGPGQNTTTRITRSDIAFGTAAVLATTAVVSPLVHLWPHHGGWFALLYLVPILWASNRGLRGGLLVASGSGVAYILGSIISSVLFARGMTHDEFLGQFVGLVIFSLVGAITGAYQQARLSAESALVQSNLELEKRHESLELVNRLADRLRRTLNDETIAQEAVNALVRLSRPPMVAVYLLNDHDQVLERKAHHGFDEETLKSGVTLSLTDSLSGIAIANRKPLICDDISIDEKIDPAVRDSLLRSGCRSAVSIPLIFEEHTLGSINLVFADMASVTNEDLSSYTTIGRTVALALVNARHVARLEHLAFHDEMTGLPNRKGLHRWLSECDLSKYGEKRKLGLVLVGLDRFDEVNDALGHHIGDQVLAMIGPKIISAQTDESPLVFRLGGDKFAVILPDLERASESETLTSTLLAALAEPFEVNGITLKVEASAGIAIFPEDGNTGPNLIRCAGVAVSHAKRISSHIVRYSRPLDQHTPERLALASDLSRAIRADQLRLYYQSQVDLRDKRLIGFEALVRWQHPTLGLLPPGKFIPLAEVGEQIQPLTYWVVEQAIEQLKRWQQRNPSLTMAINLSTRNLIDRSCGRHLVDIMREADINPKTIEFELTETALVIDPEATAATLSAISDYGARVVIDDFGTGYSSLAFLKRFPIHGLKIDRSFVGDMLSDLPSRAIVRATVQLAQDLDLTVMAEGVENPGTVDALAEMGCPLGQGFYFLHPSSPKEVEDRMVDWGHGLVQ